MKSRVIVALLFIAACAPSGEAVKVSSGSVGDGAQVVAEEVVAEEVAVIPEPADALEQCDAKDYRPMIGTPVAIASLPAGEFLRAYGENDIIVQDYLPRRTSIVYDAGSVVRSVYCG